MRDPAWSVSIRENWRSPRERYDQKDIHLVFSESLSQCYTSFIGNIIRWEIQLRECLSEKTEDHQEKDTIKIMFTLVSPKVRASALPPLSSIILYDRSSVVSVYKSRVKIFTKRMKKKRCSPCFSGKHQPVLWLLHHRFHCMRDWAWWVSIREKWRYW
jgi:hypothetical protein